MSGKFIVLEGIDGSGKTTQAQRLVDELRKRDIAALWTKEPSEGFWHALPKDPQPEVILHRMIMDRHKHLREVILPALKKGWWVICDRYVSSTRAYQKAAGIPAAIVEEALLYADALDPDLTLWLKFNVLGALIRVDKAGRIKDGRERFEKFEFLCDVDTEYSKIPGLIPVDGCGTEEEVTARLVKEISCRFFDMPPSPPASS